MDYFEKLKQLPCEIVKESGRLAGNYALRISISGGIWFLDMSMMGNCLADMRKLFTHSVVAETILKKLLKRLSRFSIITSESINL